jgi:hypothetical protein
MDNRGLSKSIEEHMYRNVAYSGKGKIFSERIFSAHHEESPEYRGKAYDVFFRIREGFAEKFLTFV